MKYFRVKYGYGKDEFYSVDETEVGKAVRAQIKGTVFLCKEGTVAGNNIVAISPDYNRLLGYNRDYAMTGEDYDEIPHSAQRDHQLFLEDAKLGLSDGEDFKRLGN